MQRALRWAGVFLTVAAAATAQINLGDITKAVGKAKAVKKAVRGERATAAANAGAPAGAATEPSAVGDGTIALWVEKQLSSRENPLHSEVTINGKTVNIFTADTWEPVEQYLQPGWNTIEVTTTPQEPASSDNGLFFRVGPVTKDPKNNRMTMAPVLWEFRNGSDWKFDESSGTFRHALGPKVKEVTISMKVYWAGLEDERREMDRGDWVLVSSSNASSWNVPVTGTVFVNDHPLNSFSQHDRQVVITPYLKKGKNEIKIVSARVANAVRDNDIKFAIAGPARWNASEGKFTLKPVLEFRAMQGWTRNEEEGTLVNRAKPDSDVVERVITFMIKDSDQAGGA